MIASQLKMIKNLILTIVLSGFFCSTKAQSVDTAALPAQELAAPSKHEEFNVSKTILEHISDDYSWHLWGHTSIPLPVILYTDKGLEVFSSAHLMNEHHEPVVYQGNYPYILKEGKIIIDPADTAAAGVKVWDFSITKNVVALFITVFVLILVFVSVGAAYKKTGVTTAPKGLQSFIEPIILFMRDEVIKPNIGHTYKKYLPYLLTLFFFILINNLLGLIPIFPGGANLSGNISFTFTLAMFTFLIVTISANRHYWQHIFWMPGLSVPMKIFLAPIELLGIFTKPISLMIRLFANITAGHILVLSLVCLIFIFKSLSVSVIVVPFTLFIDLIELLVAFLQAYIFVMLSSMYIGMAVDDGGHH